MNRRRMQFAAAGVIAMLLDFMPVAVNAQMSKVKTVWVIPMENHNWTSNNTGAAFGAPDIKGGPKAPYINSVLANTAAFAEQYNPPGNLNSQGWRRPMLAHRARRPTKDDPWLLRRFITTLRKLSTTLVARLPFRKAR